MLIQAKANNLVLEPVPPDAFVLVYFVSYIRTNRARCALYKKVLDLLDKESVTCKSNG